MARLELRDISNRLAESNGVEEVVAEFLGYLQAVRPDWRASLVFHDGPNGTLHSLYHRERRGIVQNALRMSVDDLPVRLVRKFFRPSAFFNRSGHRTLLAHLIQSSPAYEADAADRERLAGIAAMPHWKSCVCLPLNDRDNVLALLVITSMERGAITSADIADLIPVKSMASLALAQQMMLSDAGGGGGEQHLRDSAAALHTQVQHLQRQIAELESENHALGERLAAATAERDGLTERANRTRGEMSKLRAALARRPAEESGPPQIDDVALTALAETQQTVQFIREVFQVLSQEHRRETFAATLLTWYCEYFGVERCTLMIFDEPSESLRIAAFRGIEPEVARGVRVRLGDGISGWVARNRRPLFMRERERNGPGAHTDQDEYNSDSYICVPLVYDGRLFGVLNLSNKIDGEVFDDIDLDRATLTGAVLGMALGSREAAVRAGTSTRARAAA